MFGIYIMYKSKNKGCGQRVNILMSKILQKEEMLLIVKNRKTPIKKRYDRCKNLKCGWFREKVELRKIELVRNFSILYHGLLIFG